jgi:hypothetical protein
MRPQGTFNQWEAEIYNQRLKEGAAPTAFRRNVCNESELLKALARELSYRPPPPNRFDTHLKSVESRASSAEAEKDFPDGPRIRSRHEELIALEGKLTAYLDAANYLTSVDETATAMQQREAVRFLLSKIPDEVLQPPSSASIYEARILARDEAINGLRVWLVRLHHERDRIKAEIEETEARGDVIALTGPPHNRPRLWRQLSDVLCASADAAENLRMVNESAFDPAGVLQSA